MATKSQVKTLKDKDNEVVRLSTKEKVYSFYKENREGYTIREAAKLMGLPYRVVQPRTSELIKSTLLIECGERIENKQPNSILKINRTPNLFGYGNKSKFQLLKMAVEKCTELHVREAILDEFERLSK